MYIINYYTVNLQLCRGKLNFTENVKYFQTDFGARYLVGMINLNTIIPHYKYVRFKSYNRCGCRLINLIK